MSEQDPQLDENEKSTLDEKRESEDTADELADLFKDEGDSEEAPTREEYNRLLKGTQKLATELGRLKAVKPEVNGEEKKEEPKKDDTNTNPVLKSLYFKANPEAQEVWEEVEKEAKALGKDPFTLYEASSYFKGEAKARAAEKAEEEANKAKITKPSNTPGGSSKFDPSKVKVDEVEKLKPSEKIAWVRHQASLEDQE